MYGLYIAVSVNSGLGSKEEVEEGWFKGPTGSWACDDQALDEPASGKRAPRVKRDLGKRAPRAEGDLGCEGLDDFLEGWHPRRAQVAVHQAHLVARVGFSSHTKH
jgi:hypothetical protein